VRLRVRKDLDELALAELPVAICVEELGYGEQGGRPCQATSGQEGGDEAWARKEVMRAWAEKGVMRHGPGRR